MRRPALLLTLCAALLLTGGALRGQTAFDRAARGLHSERPAPSDPGRLYQVTNAASSSDCGPTLTGGGTAEAWSVTNAAGTAWECLSDQIPSGAGGEANTASNLGAGVGVWEDKSGVDLRFNSLVSANGLLTIAEDDPNDEIDFTVNEGSFDLANLGGALGPAQIDDGGAAATQALFSGGAGDPSFRAIADADVPDSITIDLAATATALAANGGNCAAGQWAAGVDASGASEGCTVDDDVPESGDFGNAADLDADGSVSADAVALGTDTTGNYVGTVAAGAGVAVSGADGEGATKTVAFDFSDAGADPALGGDECRFSSEGVADGGWVCEGATADLNETRFRVTDPTAERVVVFPDAGGEVSLLGQTIETGEAAAAFLLESESPAAGDVSGTFAAGLTVGDDSHAHTSSTVSGLDAANDIASGLLALAHGGTGADLSATGGANQFVRQSTLGGALSVGAIADADVPDTITIDLAATATALAANGGNCAAGQWAAGVDASGAAEGCTVDDDVPESGDFGNAADLDADGSVIDDSHAHTTTTVSGLDAGDTTTGTFADARIAETSVTQHIDALGASFGAGGGVDYNSTTDELEIDPTEVVNPTWSDGAQASDTWTFNLATGTDPTITFGDNSVTFNTPISASSFETTGGVGTLTLDEGTAPGAPGAAGKHTLYFDSADSRLHSHENAGSAVEYLHDGDTVDALASSTSAELATLLSDETGSGAAMFGTNPALGGYLDVPEIATPANPGADVARFYSKDDGGTTKLYYRDAGGTETELGGGGGGGSSTAQIEFQIADARFPDNTTGNERALLDAGESSATAPAPFWHQLLYSTGDIAQWQGVIPPGFGSSVSIQVQFKLASATTGNTAWDGRILCVTPGDAQDVDADAFAAVNTSADNGVPGTAGHLDSSTWSLTNDDGCAAGDFYVFLLERASPSGTDASGDAEVVSARLTYTVQ